MLSANQDARGEDSDEVYLPMSRSDIAAYVGTSLEAVSRAFQTLVRRGAISFRDRRHVRIIGRRMPPPMGVPEGAWRWCRTVCPSDGYGAGDPAGA